MDKDLQEIAEELKRIEYGELHIIVRGGEIVSYTSIKSTLKPTKKASSKSDTTKNILLAKEENIYER
jgi:hypothetical protein